jgi:hypothetical protein
VRSSGVVAAAVAFVLCVGATSALARGETPLLSGRGIGDTHFGARKTRAVRELSTVLGRPSRRFEGCGPTVTEVEWGHLYVEFWRGKFSGFRYMQGAWSSSGAVSGSRVSPLRPHLATSAGITLGSTLRQLRERYPRLTLVGTDRWQNHAGIIFSVSFATRQPPSPNSRITEIKYGTCGDW